MAKKGKKFIEAKKLVDSTSLYAVEEAVELVKKTNVAKFDATVYVAFRLGVDLVKRINKFVELWYYLTELVKIAQF